MKGFVESEEIKSRANGLKSQSLLFVETMNNHVFKNNVLNWEDQPAIDRVPELLAVDLYRIDRLFFDENQSINGKLVNIYTALSGQNSNVLLVITGKKQGVDFYIGVGNVKNENHIPGQILQKNMKGCFPGIRITGGSSVNEILGSIPCRDHISVISGIPKKRITEEEGFVQGIEKLIDAMNGEEYVAVLIAEPISRNQLQQEKKYYEDLFSGLSESSEWVLNYSKEKSNSHMTSSSQESGKSTGTSTSDSQGTGQSTETSKTKVESSGTSQGEEMLYNNWNKLLNESKGTNETSGNSVSSSENHSEGTSETSTESSGSSKSDTDTEGTNGSIQVTQQNKMILDLSEKINAQIERIHSAESMGAWNFAAYFISAGYYSEVAANIYKSLIVGETAYPDDYLLHTWDKNRIGEAKFSAIEQYLRSGNHPLFYLNGACVTPATMINGMEMPLIGGLPQKSVNGVAVLTGTEFGRNVSNNEKSSTIEIGALYHMGEVYPDNRVQLDINSLTSHCFITGSTGSGKSNTTYKLLSELNRYNVTFLVIEPAKGEYKLEFGELEGLNIFTTNPRYYSMLSVNPFEFNEEIHVLEHVERLLEVFSACWPLYAAMPAVLKDTFERAYIEHGWDLHKSFHMDVGNGQFPTFSDILRLLPMVVRESQFAGETRDNYIGALYTRIRSLTTGIIGQVLNGPSVSDTVLFDENTIIDLSRVGSTETKSLLMGILVLKLNEHRMASKVRNAPLKHVTVIEEAHNLLKRTASTGQNQESADVQGKAVEMMSASIAETRTYGEGFIIVDQSPTAVDVSAIKNTNTKIAMRLPEAFDAEAIGHAMGLSEKQILELSRLEQGVAAIYQSGWKEPVLVKIDKSDEQHSVDRVAENHPEENCRLRGKLISELLRQYEDGKYREDAFIRHLRDSGLDRASLEQLLEYLRQFEREFGNGNPAVRNRALLSCAVCLMACSDMLRACEGSLPKEEAVKANQIGLADMQQAIRWKRLILGNLDKYVSADSDEFRMKLLMILVKYGIEFSQCTEQYKVLQYCLKNERNWRSNQQR